MSGRVVESWTAWTDGDHSVIDGPEDSRGRVEQIALVYGDDHEDRGKVVAAAPEMLEELRWILAASRREAEMWHRGLTGGERPELTVNVVAYERGQSARAAIAKAVGATP